MGRRPLRGLEWLGGGRPANIETRENRFADMETREESGWDAGARATRPRGGWKAENKRKCQCFP